MKVFLSSTYEDLVEYRERVRDVLISCEETFKGMEFFGASEHSSLKTCLDQLTESDLVICLVGTRYGSKPIQSELSYTHHEINEALKLNLPIFIYMIDEEKQPILRKFIDQGDDEKALSDLKFWLKEKFTVEQFTTPEDLAVKIARDLSKRSSQKDQSFLAKNKLRERVVSRYRECAYDSVAEWYDYWYQGHWNHDEPFKTICAIAGSYWEGHRNNISTIKILDCACGTGNTFAAFAKAGYQIFGTDGSREMLDRAFSNCNKLDVPVSNLIPEPINWTDLDSYLSYFERESFDLIVITANSFCHIPQTSEYMQRALSNFHTLLKPRGLLLIDTKKYIQTTPINEIPTYMELLYEPAEKEWRLRSERLDKQELEVYGTVYFHTNLLYDKDPSFGEIVNRALIVITIYGEKVRPRILVIPYYPLPSNILSDQMSIAGFKSTLFPAMEKLTERWKYDVVVGQKSP